MPLLENVRTMLSVASPMPERPIYEGAEPIGLDNYEAISDRLAEDGRCRRSCGGIRL
jgi:hypothetical protein